MTWLVLQPAVVLVVVGVTATAVMLAIDQRAAPPEQWRARWDELAFSPIGRTIRYAARNHSGQLVVIDAALAFADVFAALAFSPPLESIQGKFREDGPYAPANKTILEFPGVAVTPIDLAVSTHGETPFLAVVSQLRTPTGARVLFEDNYCRLVQIGE